ncbi:RYamide receptor-like [Babylonia areolata]|uniref:RYamide receptor-like n=1 Tax=Babylonia areolata TaxID=304850 RepID=UPI003FD00EED
METFVVNVTLQESGEMLVKHNITTESMPDNGSSFNPLQADLLPAFKNVIIILYVLVIVVALIGNGSVIYLVLSQRQMRNVTNYFIASLATSDAFMALVCIPITFITNVLVDSWPFPAWMCPFGTYVQIVVVFQNAYTLIAISLERYVAIMYPFKRRLTIRQCCLIIILTWFMSFGTPLPTAVVSKLEEFPTKDVNVSEIRCYEVWPTEKQLFTYSMTIMVLQYFVPLAVLTYTYLRIVIVVWLKDTPPHGRMGTSSMRPVLQHQDSVPAMDASTGQCVDPRKRIIKMMMTVVGIYGVCWLPIHLITILGDTNPDIWTNPAMRYVWVSAHWLAMSSCMYNPIIYWWMSEKFRCGFQFLLDKIKYMCCKRGRDHLRTMNGWRAPFNNSSFTQGNDFQSRHRGSYAGVKAEGRERNNYETMRANEAPPVVRNEVLTTAPGRGGGENGLSLQCSVGTEHRETIPLRMTADRIDCSVGCEDGSVSDEVLPVNV